MPQGPAPAVAQTTGLVDEDLVDLQSQFASGQFQRTTVNGGTVTGNAFDDRDGMLQLAPVGFLRPWDVLTPGLPQPLAAMGVTTIGNRLYTVGGATSASGDAFTDAVYWTTINQQTGAPSNHNLAEGTKPPGSFIVDAAWINDPLPAAAAFTDSDSAPYPDCPGELIRARRGPAVASFITGTGTDYIYSIGGAFAPPPPSICTGNVLTSPVVQIGRVTAANGDITWSSGNDQRANYLPSQNLPNFENWDEPFYISLPEESYGVEGATASVVTTSGGTYLYVIGGLVTYLDVLGLQTMVTPAVFYTKLNPNTGALQDPNPNDNVSGVWARADNVPLHYVTNPAQLQPPGELGIYNHTAIVSQGADGRSAIYVIGGFTQRPGLGSDRDANPFVFRAIVNDDGTLRWETDLYPPYDDEEGVTTEGAGRADVAGFVFANKLYVIGGRPGEAAGDAPLGTVTMAVHNDQLDLLPLFQDDVGTPTYFSGNQGPQVLSPVYGHGAAVVSATPPPGATEVLNAAWGYAIGGYRMVNNSLQPTDIIYRGAIGGPQETADARRVPDGWYYSPFYNIRLNQGTEDESEARIVSVRWFSGIDRSSGNPNADLRIEFRRTKLQPCNAAAFEGSQWVALDGDSATAFYSKAGNSAHEIKLQDIFYNEDFSASCMQFRVYMTQNGSTNGVPNPSGAPTQSPQLFRLAIQKIKPGDPDLYLTRFNIGPDESGRIATFDLRITNLNGTVLNTVPVTDGQFPVVLCVAYSETDPNVPLTLPTLPITDDTDDRVDCAPIYRWIDPSETVPGQEFILNGQPNSNVWQVNYPNWPHLPSGLRVDGVISPVQLAFAKPGHYAVAALIDPYNEVLEGGQGKANNRGENLNNGQPLIRRFTITEEGFISKTYMPVIVTTP